MDKVAERIAKLSPEKRALLLQKLKTRQQKQEGAGSPSARPEGERPTPGPLAQGQRVALASDESFCCEIRTPGNLGNLSFRKVLRIPPGSGQIQVKAEAVSINFRDLMIALGIYPPTPNVPSNMGSDYAGTVVAIGEGVDEFEPGDKVIVLSAGHLTPNSHFSAYTNVFTAQAVRKPHNMSFEEAACIPTVFSTAYYALYHQARLAGDERVLIHSATGGVGLAAEILATAGTPERREYLKSLGIRHPMDSRSTDFAGEVIKITVGEGVDVILNSLPGEAVQKGLEILRVFGRFMQIDKREVYQNSALELRCFNKGLTFSAIDLGLFLSNPAKLKSLLSELVEHFNEGTFRPLPHRIYPVWELGDALGYMSQAKHIGKLVLSYRR